MKKIHLLIIFLFVIFGILVVENLPQDTLHLSKKAETASKRGARWLIEYSDPYKDPGIIWVIKKINESYCGSLPHIDEFVHQRFTEFSEDPIEKYYSVLIDKNTQRDLDYNQLIGREARYDDIILPMLYCQEKTIPESTLAKIFASNHVTGYELSHRFLALQFMKENQCLGEQKIKTALDQTAQYMVEEQKYSAFSDLYAERIAFLQYGGYERQVKDEWLGMLVQSQSPSGAWKDPVYFDTTDNPHTTALSVWALTNYTKKCPF